MEATKRKPDTLGQRGRAKKRDKYFFRPSHLNKSKKYFQGKSHWSRHPEQRRMDAAILASIGLVFRGVPGTHFSRFAPASSQELEEAS